MNRKDELDGVGCERSLYCFQRNHGLVTNRGWANYLWSRWHRPRRTTFVVDSQGEALHLPSARAALIAELRIMPLEQD